MRNATSQAASGVSGPIRSVLGSGDAQCGLARREFSSVLGGGRRGFTLLELLVVIAIVAVLATLLLPTVNTLRGQAKSMTCLSYMRQSSLGIQSFAGDNRGVFTFQTFSLVEGERTWARMVVEGGYTDANRIFSCPAVPSLFQPWLIYQYRCYGVRGYTYIPGVTWSIPRYISYANDFAVYYRFSKVTAPANVAFLTDTVDAKNIFAVNQFYKWYDGTGTSGQNGGAIHFRHLGRANVIFVDGHGEAMYPRTVAINLTTEAGDPARQLWGAGGNGLPLQFN